MTEQPSPAVAEAFEEYQEMSKALWNWYKDYVAKHNEKPIRTARIMTALFAEFAIMLAVDTQLPEDKFLLLCKEHYKRRFETAPKWE